MNDEDRFLLWVSWKTAELRDWPRELTIVDSSGNTHVVDSGRDDLLRQLEQLSS